MIITDQVLEAMSQNVAVPVIIKVKPTGLSQLQAHLGQNFGLFSGVIPRFNMLSCLLPPEVIDEIKQMNFIENVYYDRAVRIPEIKGAELSFDPIKRFILKIRQTVAARAVTLSKPGWFPTLESRVMVGADIAEQEGYTGKGVKCAAVDTDSSARYTQQPQLRGRVSGIPLIDEVSDKNGHGGHVMTTILGSLIRAPVSLLQAKGMAPGATGIGIKVLRGVMGAGTTSDVINGLSYADQWGANVINLSLGGDPTPVPTDDPMFPVMEELRSKAVVCCAIGNSGPGSSTTNAPGSLPNVVSVGAVDKNGAITSFSSRGPTPDGRTKPEVAAPGVNIWSGITLDTYLDYVSDYLPNGFTAISGTSMATPHVTGLMALATELFQKELGTKLTTDLALDVIRQHGGVQNNNVGYGIINWSWFTDYVKAHK